jgi:hypothetical protein
MLLNEDGVARRRLPYSKQKGEGGEDVAFSNNTPQRGNVINFNISRTGSQCNCTQT